MKHMKTNMTFLVGLISLLIIPSLATANNCQSFVGETPPITLKAADFSHFTINTLIGSHIKYKAKYNFRDPSDSRLTQGEGFVTAVQFYNNSGNHPSSFQITLVNAKDERQTLEFLVTDHTLNIKQIPSPQAQQFLNDAKDSHLTIASLGVDRSYYPKWETLFGKYQSVKLLFLEDGTSGKIREIQTQKIILKPANPLDLMLGKASVIIIVETTSDEKLEINIINVLLMALKP